MAFDQVSGGRTVAIVGGGFSGAVMALKLALACPADRVILIEKNRRAGVGLAYGACAPFHLLNVPASRMELGLEPGFRAWLAASGEDLSDAVAEAGGALSDAFVPRALFGRYVEERFAAALAEGSGAGLHRIRGEAVRMLEAPARGVVLADGREIAADVVVLATGNLAPARVPAVDPAGVAEDPRFVPDPWSPDAFENLAPDAPVLLIGAGLTMADIVLLLDARGHRGPVTALSRHGWRPSRHAAGGTWAPFLAAAAPKTPLQALRLVRAELARAQARGTPWQRVFDAARPDVARVWRSWSPIARRRFLKRLRTLWDVHRHRMAPRIADAMDGLSASGRLTYVAGRLIGLTAGAGGLAAHVALRGGGETRIGPVARIVNCTGPQSDFARLESPLYGHLRRRDLIRPDALRLGLETDHSAVLDAAGRPSPWLYALGPLARPDLWEVTAVPEINAQIDALVKRLASMEEDEGLGRSPLDAVFADLGAGI